MAISSSNGKTVLITGINGYIASVLGMHLLSKGYSIRGTSRRATTAESLLTGPYAPYASRVKMYEVPDMTVSGAFDEAVKGVHGIFHTASPISFSSDMTYATTVVPAVKGSQSILFSALNAGPQLTSIVITSSVASIIDYDNPDPEYHYTEHDFASTALSQATSDLSSNTPSPAHLLYAASKTAADRAVWDFRLAQTPRFAVSTINPAIVIGPPMLLPPSGDKLNETLRSFFNIFAGKTKQIPPTFGSGAFVDVRDVALMHVWAHEHAVEASGERYIACAGFGPAQAVADVLRREYEDTAIGAKIARGRPGEGYLGYDSETGVVGEIGYPSGRIVVDGSKGMNAMGFKYRTFPQSIADTAKALEGLL